MGLSVVTIKWNSNPDKGWVGSAKEKSVSLLTHLYFLPVGTEVLIADSG